MTVVETLLVFVVAPLAVVLLAYALVLLPALKDRARYKPGTAWGHAAVWYEPHPEGGAHGAEHDADHGVEHTTGEQAAALTIGETAGHPRRTASGGARGTW
ncbi:hypothetical protein SAMN05660199_02170 [Klenkia soli]|uniref:Uncharacterized protein n=1 Tax=Klenkia soli TaxID=1052260 RepID=A0A1H0KKT5_9ACTN|nr:hypothetical protein [Klenkia soli]SDO56433.1 hypothetical protein SAMN05660199_02170 [Klenkia soli]